MRFSTPLSLLLCALAACSPGDDGDDGSAEADTRDRLEGDAAGEGDAATEGAGDAQVGEDAAPEIISIDVPTVDLPRPDVGPDARVDEECAQVTAVGDPVYAPIDIIWAIDTSGSMGEETTIIAERLNEFVAFVESSGLDVRVIMVADSSVCVPAPLAGGGCPDTDTDRYTHIRATVSSNDAYQVLEAQHPAFAPHLRGGAIKHFVIVSDDESATEFGQFREAMRLLGLRHFILHAIVSLIEDTSSCMLGICEGCSGPYGSAVAKGARYMVGATATGGTASSICEEDWSRTFEGISENVLSGAVLPCQYAIPDLGEGREIAFDRVDVRINGVLLTRHVDAAGCATAPGWYYDDNADPGKVYLCPGVCGGGLEGVEVEIEFGCVKG